MLTNNIKFKNFVIKIKKFQISKKLKMLKINYLKGQSNIKFFKK